MFNTLKLVLIWLVTLLLIQTVYGDHPLQTLLSRLECYETTQAGCNTDLTAMYPELSRSYDNTSEASTRFYLFTKDNPDDPELMHKCVGGLPPVTKFNPNCKTEIFFPGFVSGVCHFAIYRELKNERLKCGCYNVILVEWTWGNSFDLIGATKNMKIAAKQAVIVIRKLKEKYGLGPDHFICTGHSLGAHACGFIGQEESISTINGLDPSGVVYWENMPLDERLDAGDAKCVQVTHCNAGQCLPQAFGVNFTCGTKDFWFNDGFNQPSCYLQMFKSFLKGDIIYALFSLIPAACQHLQCLQYYKASMCTEGCNFIAVECKNASTFLTSHSNSCGSAGENCDVTGAYCCDCGSGTIKNYCLKTDFFCPYCDNSGMDTQGYSCQALNPYG